MSSMDVTELRRRLSAIEPDEGTFADIGADDVVNLRALLTDEETWLAARATHALAGIQTPNAKEALVEAADSSRPEVRIAAARVAGQVGTELSDQLLIRLLDDDDNGVRKFAVTSTSGRNGGSVKSRLQEMARTDSVDAVRNLAADRVPHD